MTNKFFIILHKIYCISYFLSYNLCDQYIYSYLNEKGIYIIKFDFKYYFLS